ncbi:MAG: hypothetical protein ABIP27_17390 [Flavobacterium circumlabens]|uniref:hypothetical protein n=1 Tax=Flavobacterium circumlabens TaxID=2133765 RepID=UPI0032669929
MAIQSLNTIKNWFKTGLIPTQSQFWDTWDSFRHRSEQIPVDEVDGINELLQNKTEQEVFDAHLTDLDAHPNLLVKARIIPKGQFIVFKVAPNENDKIKEAGDYCIGMVEDSFLMGNWDGEDDQLKSSYY